MAEIYGSVLEMTPFITIIIPAKNAAKTLDACLGAASAQQYPSFEVILVDDASTDSTPEIIAQHHGIRHVKLDIHGGASKARNRGAREAKGEHIFFTDADCVMNPDALKRAAEAIDQHPGAIIGGTYALEPFDNSLWSRFQAVFVNFSETKQPAPDYIATHAMLIERELFIESGGFKEDFMPILEDVEFSHRMRDAGLRLVMEPGLEVAHIFDFTLMRSLKNAFRKTRHWVRYSLGNRDMFKDSGTASLELKLTVTCWAIVMGCMGAYLGTGMGVFIISAGAFYIICLLANFRFIRALHRAHGTFFMLKAMLYYTLLYPAPIAAGACAGILSYLRRGVSPETSQGTLR